MNAAPQLVDPAVEFSLPRSFPSCRNVNAAMSGQRVQRLNRDDLAKASRPGPLSSTSGIRVARRGRRRPRPRIAKGARSGGRWPKRVAPPQLRRASGVRPEGAPEDADATKVIHVLS